MSAVAIRLPTRRPVTALVAALTISGLGCVVVAGWELQRLSSPVSSEQFLLVAATVLIGDISLLRIRFGANGNSFTWGEAALIIGTVIGGWPVLIIAGTTTVLVRQLAARRPLYKCLFNAGAFAIGTILARLTFSGITGDWSARIHGGALSFSSLLALGAAAAIYFLWNSIVVALAVGWSQAVPVFAVWTKGAGLRTLMFLGNTAAGLGAVAVNSWTPQTLLLLALLLLGIYYVYNNALRVQLDLDRWRELQAATLELQHVDARAVTEAVQRGAEALFGAEITALLLSGDPAAVRRAPAVLAAGLAARGPVIVKAREESPQLRRELAELGVVEGVLAPLESVSGRTGVLLVGFRGVAYLKRRELQVVGTFANHASASMQRARLFGEVDEQRTRLSAVIDNASDGVVLVGADGVVASWNPGMARLTNRSEDSAVGQQLDGAFFGKSADGTSVSIADAFAKLDRVGSADHLTADVTLDMADGSIREAAVSVSAVRAPGGACEFAVIVARDITAHREVQQAKQDFIATVSHELRTPLTPIKGYLSLFLRPDFQMAEPQRRAVMAELLDRTNQLERLVEDLLSTSRIEHGEFSLRPEATDVSRVVERAVADLSPASGRTLSQYTNGRPTQAMCDPARLQQVLANVLSNADKYSPSTEPVVIGVHFAADEIEIAVQDFGAGIAKEQQDEVFEPFRRLGDHLTRDTRGCGLGLHIAKRLVEGMGGRIWVDSRLGEGSTFHVTVPAAASALPPASVLPPAPEPDEILALDRVPVAGGAVTVAAG